MHDACSIHAANGAKLCMVFDECEADLIVYDCVLHDCMHVRKFFNSKYSDRKKVLAKVDGPFVTMPRVLHVTYGRLQVKFQKQLHAVLGFPGIFVTKMQSW